MPRQLIRRLSQISAAIVVAVLLMVLTTAVVFAEPRSMSAPDTNEALTNNDLIVLDIRSPGEWAETGIAKGAWPVTMHSPDFKTNLQAIVQRHPNTPIGLICATGGRSNYVATILEENGLHNVIDVSEGMFGNGDAPGWIARDLPIVDFETAHADYQKSLFLKE